MEGRGCRRKVFSPKKKRDRASHYKVNNGWLEKLRAAALVRVTNSRKFSKDKGCGGNLCNGEVNVASGKGVPNGFVDGLRGPLSVHAAAVMDDLCFLCWRRK